MHHQDPPSLSTPKLFYPGLFSTLMFKMISKTLSLLNFQYQKPPPPPPSLNTAVLCINLYVSIVQIENIYYILLMLLFFGVNHSTAVGRKFSVRRIFSVAVSLVSEYLQCRSIVLVLSMVFNFRRHGKGGDLGDPGSRKILQIVEDLNKNIKQFLKKSIQKSKQPS